ncbi:MAG TPA: hypothetical protein VK688_10580 [Gemmatimonadales bacterium]|nr:hypothetical protein [Gemmatimonadales bacterium]
MRLLDVERTTEGDRVALVGRIERGGRVDQLFFRFPADMAGSEPPNADPFFAALLVPALASNESLVVDPPVSPRLLRRAHRVQDILTSWYETRRRIDVVATARAVPSEGGPRRGNGVGTFFSGGVDSCYTLLKNRLGLPSLADPITHLIFVKGFDAPLSEAEQLGESEVRLRATAARHGCVLVAVETNLREVVPAPWGEMQCGSALAAVGLALGSMLRTVLIPASYEYGDLIPHGTHPLLDEAWSTETTEFIHDGSEVTRVAKLAALVQHAPDMVDQLRVCWESGKGGPDNCGHCGKCLRTMTSLRAVGHLGATTSFPNRLPPEYPRAFTPNERAQLGHVLEQARRVGDKELVRGLARQARALDLKDGLRRALRALPLTAAVLDARASVVRQWRRR